jgi:hypothetical protein
MSGNNRRGCDFYQSQAQKHRARLVPSLCTSHALPSHCRSPAKLERAIDVPTSPRSPHIHNQLLRNKSAEIHRYRSPTRDTPKVVSFNRIIEEMNDNNDQTLEQLDLDLRRIKDSLGKGEEEFSVKREEEGSALLEEVELMQEDN